MKKLLEQLGLAPYLALITTVLMLLLTAAIVKTVSVVATRQVAGDIGNNLAELAFQTTDKLDRSMFERYREVQLMAARHELGLASMSADTKRMLLENMQQTYPYYAWIGLTDNDGTVKVATRKLLEGADVSKRPWFSNAYRNIHLTDVHEAVLLAKLLPNPGNEPKRFFDIAFPYRDEAGKTVGILGIHLNWQWAQEIERSVIQPLARTKKIDTLIVDRNSIVLLGPDHLKGAQLQQASFTNAQQAGNGSLIEQWPDGKQYLVGFSKSDGHLTYPGFGWTVLVRQELDQAYQPIHDLQNLMHWGGLAVALIFALFAFVIANRITKPLRSIARSAQEMESGSAVEIHAPSGSFREVYALTNSLNSLLKKLVANDQSLRDLNTGLEARVAQRTADLTIAANELKASEQRVRSIIDTALDAFVEIDANGNISDWNPQAEAIFGWRRDEVLGMSVATTVIPARFRQMHDKGLERFSLSGSSGIVGKRLQLFAMRRNGDEFPVEMTIGLVNTGTAHFFSAFIQDISARKKVENDLAKERELLNAVLDTIDVGVVACDREGKLNLFNRSTKLFHGVPAGEDLPPEQWSRHYNLFHADGKTAMQAEEIPLLRALAGNIVHGDEMVVRSRSGQLRSLLVSGRSMVAGDGHQLGAVVVMRDITEQRRILQQLQQSQQRLATIADNMPVTILYLDQEERYQYCNKTYEQWFERPAHSLYGKTIEEVFREQGYGEETYLSVRPFVRNALSGQRVNIEMQRLIRGESRHLEAIYIPDWNSSGEVAGFYAMIHDITVSKTQALRFEHHATHDTLTGLPNRRAFMDRLEQAIARAQRKNKPLAVLFLDLNKFKHINDTFGHATGDKVLIAFADRLKRCVRKTDTVARLAGDEFVIIAEELAQAEPDAMLIAEKIILSLAEPLLNNEPIMHASTSIGIAICQHGNESADDLLNRADQAMYQAKQGGANEWRFSCTPEVHEEE